MYISHSQVDLYTSCPYKYFLTRIEKWETDKTYSALLFGSAMDTALNYILLRSKHHHVPYYDTAALLFQREMEKWHGQNELVYFKNEAPPTETFDDLSDEDKQEAVFINLCTIGRAILKLYIDTILPQLGTILAVQTKRFIPNKAGDKLILVVDFKARLPDGREVTFDNKTSSDIKKYYGPSSVQKSDQLAIYTEYEPSRLAGYVAISKRPQEGKENYTIRVDTISEARAEEAFEKVDTTLRAIKAKEFPKNEKSCWAFGRRCEMWDLCKKGKTTGLKKRGER